MLDTGIRYQEQLYSVVLQKLKETSPPSDDIYKPGFIGGSVFTAGRSVNYQIFVDKEDKIICKVKDRPSERTNQEISA